MSEKAKWAAMSRAVENINKWTRRLANGEDVGERLAFWVSRRNWIMRQGLHIGGCCENY